MKTTTVILIVTKNGEFITNLSEDVKNIPAFVYNGVDSTGDIKHAQYFNNIEDAKYALERISKNWGGSVKTFKYEIDDSFLGEARNVVEIN
jgi:hypothetical protein